MATTGSSRLTRDDVARIEAIADLAERNRQITRAYHALSSDLAGFLGRENATWCTFAVWASDTVGELIRLGDHSEQIGNLLEKEPGYPAARSVLDDRLRPLRVLARVASLHHGAIIDSVASQFDRVRRKLAEGNTSVFRDAAPWIIGFRDALDADRYPAFRKAAHTASTPGRTRLMLDVFDSYHAAVIEPAPHRRAQHVLLANVQLVAWEQRRLDRVIKEALVEPMHGPVLRLARSLTRTLPLLERPLHVVREIEQAANHTWDHLMTELVMVIAAPPKPLPLGRDLTPIDGKPLFPAVLGRDAIEVGALRTALHAYDHSDGTGGRTAVTDWTDYHQRMNFIVNFFRSRQQETCLFDEPHDVVA